MLSLAIASDHAGVSLKEEVLFHLRKKNYVTIDLGPHSANESVDYPDYAEKVVKRILDGTVDAGIAICGTGIGMSIAANKFAGIRAVCPWDRFTSEMTRKHNNSNILCLGARTLDRETLFAVLDTWLVTPFEGGRHQNRLDKITNFES